MNPRFWNSIASLPTLSALMTVWEYLLGDQFAQAAPFLSPCNLQADYYPSASQHRCQCMHRIIYHSPDEIEAVCECGEGACESFPLTLDDLRIQSVNLRLLAAALAPSSALTPPTSPPAAPAPGTSATAANNAPPSSFQTRRPPSTSCKASNASTPPLPRPLFC